MKTDYTKKQFDWVMLISIIFLLGIGVAMCASASYVRSSYQGNGADYLMRRQLLATGLGLGAMIAASLFDYKALIKRFSSWFYLLVLALNFFTAFFGKEENGARRWFAIGSRNLFQPSELMKLAIILYLAALLSDEEFGIRSKGFEGVITILVPFGTGCLSVLLQKHTSATIIIFVIGVSMMFFAGLYKRLWITCVILGGGAVGGIVLLKPDLFSHVTARLNTYTHTFLGIVNAEGVSEAELDQIQNSLWAIGSGGLFGRGFGNSIQKYSYLPEAYNDFIFAIVAEELGFVGVAIIILLYTVLILRGIKVATYADDKYGQLAATGIITMVTLQTVLNISVVSCLIPVTGVSLPFFSYGGTALAMLLGCMGILLSIAKQSNYSKF